MRSWAVSEIGSVRKNNEDSIYANTEKGFFVIADGMGGHEFGEVASSMAVEKFLENKLSACCLPIYKLTLKSSL